MEGLRHCGRQWRDPPPSQIESRSGCLATRVGQKRRRRRPRRPTTVRRSGWAARSGASMWRSTRVRPCERPKLSRHLLRPPLLRARMLRVRNPAIHRLCKNNGFVRSYKDSLTSGIHHPSAEQIRGGFAALVARRTGASLVGATAKEALPRHRERRRTLSIDISD